jgi:hypothetical protein
MREVCPPRALAFPCNSAFSREGRDAFGGGSTAGLLRVLRFLPAHEPDARQPKAASRTRRQVRVSKAGSIDLSGPIARTPWSNALRVPRSGPAGASTRLGIRALDAGSLPDPGSRQQVHARLRLRLPKRRDRDRPRTGASPEGERGRRTLRPHGSSRMSRLAPDRRPPPPRAGAPRLRRPLQPPPAAPGAQPHAPPNRSDERSRP